MLFADVPPTDPNLESFATNWSVINHAKQSPCRRNEVVTRYWNRVISRIARRWGGALSQSTEDVVQDFLVKMLNDNFWQTVSREKGRFRGFLNSCIDHHVIDFLRRSRPTIETIELNELSSTRDVDSEIVWAEELFREVSWRLEEECMRTGYQLTWQVAKRRLIDPVLEGSVPMELETLAESLRLESANAAAGRARTARKWMRRIASELLRELRPMSDEELDQELDEFTATLATRLPRTPDEKSPLAYLYSDMASDMEDFDPCRWRQVCAHAPPDRRTTISYDRMLSHDGINLDCLMLVRDFTVSVLADATLGFDKSAAKLLYFLGSAIALTKHHIAITRLHVHDIERNLSELRRRMTLDDGFDQLITNAIRSLRSLRS